MATLALVVGLAGCDSGGDAKAAKPKPPPTTAPPTVTRMKVDLTITSDLPQVTMQLKGTKGSCTFPSTELPATYKLSATDFLRMGPGGTLTAYGPTKVGAATVPGNIKVYLNGVGMITSAQGTGVTFQSDRRSIDIDSTLYGAVGGASSDSVDDPGFPLRGHISGTMRCIE